MIVLGVANNEYSGACLIINGEIISAVSEERFTRIKGDNIWPTKSIEYVLNYSNLELDKIDCIAYGLCAGFNPEKHFLLYFDRICEELKNNPQGINYFRKRVSSEITNDKEKRNEFDNFIKINNLSEKVIYIDHHECHGLSAYLASPFEETLVITCDSSGDFQSLTISRYSPKKCEILQRETAIDSIGYFYGRITKLIGYTPNRNEGKTTGLAPYGDSKKLLPLMEKMINVFDGKLRAKCSNYFQPSYSDYSSILEELISKEKPEDIAAAAQLHTENMIIALLENHINKKSENICLAGGIFSNVNLNKKILELKNIKNVYVLPCPGDEGLPLSAAICASYKKFDSRVRIKNLYLGPDSGESLANLKFIEDNYKNINYLKPSNIINDIVDLLAKNKVLGFFRGRLEFGESSLCNRSILYHTSDPTVNKWLNQKIGRTEFMPFAPITAIDFAKESYINYSKNHISAPYMLFTYNCTDSFKNKCRAVVHIDGTARPQIVTEENDLFIYSLLHAWYYKTGQAALINTSFNKHNEPIISTINDACDALMEGVVDAIIMNDQYIIYNYKN